MRSPFPVFGIYMAWAVTYRASANQRPGFALVGVFKPFLDSILHSFWTCFQDHFTLFVIDLDAIRD